jgi:hypothetical protein
MMRLAIASIAFAAAIVNPAIDAAAYLRVADEAVDHRVRHGLSEADFTRLSRAPGTVVLDARSQGAIHLGFPDTAVDSLAPPLPDKDVRILIYCNNNSRGDPSALPSKLPSASLNLPTYIALYDDGYRTVWELGPLIDIETAAIAFARSTSPRP